MLALAAAAAVVAACGFVAPLLLLRALQHTIDAQRTRGSASQPD